MPSHREILLATRMLFGLDEETRQAIQERIDDALAEMYPAGNAPHDDPTLVAAMDRALENCPP